MAIHTSQAPVEKKGDYGRQPNQTMVHQPTNATFSRTMIPTRNVCYHLEQGNDTWLTFILCSPLILDFPMKRKIAA